MGRESRLKKERRKARKHEKSVGPTSSGYLGMALVGSAVGLMLGVVFGKTVLAWFGSVMAGILFFLVFNRILLFFGLGPNSGSTSPPGVRDIDTDRAVASNFSGSSGGISGSGSSSAGGGGGGGAG